MLEKTKSVRSTFLPFASPLLGEEEIEEVLVCLRSGWLTTGRKVQQFQSEFAEFIGCKHAIAVSSCTAALHLALEAGGIGPGDEVITSPMTFAATAAVIEHLGGLPILADCDPETLNLDPEQIEPRITTKTKAILPVHFGGQACDMDAILDIAEQHRLLVIEDAAHAIPTRYRGRMVGTIGDATAFSFYATKNLTTGEGGMVTTDNDEWAERIRLMSLHGMSRDAWKRYMQGSSWSYEIVAPGFKYNLSDIAASIGLPQLKRCMEFHRRRIDIARSYTRAFASVRGISTPIARDDEEHSWHLYVIQLELDRLSIDRDAFIRALGERKIGVSVHFIPIHIHPYYREKYGYRPGDFPNAFRAYERLISLPIYAKMSDQDIEDVIGAVTDIAREHQR